jgi:hypothetical protein
MFTEWLVEAHYLRTFLKLSFRIPHFTTLQKFADRITGTILERILSSFILLTTVKQIFFGIDSSGFKPTYASQYYTERSGLGKKWIKLSVGADMLKQVICTIKIRRAPPARHDNVDFQPIITRTSEIKPLSVAVADKGYDSEERESCFSERGSKSIQHHSYKIQMPSNMEDTWQIQETDETWLFSDTV